MIAKTLTLLALTLLFVAAPAAADDHQNHPNGDGCYLEHEYGGCWITTPIGELGVCLYTPDGCGLMLPVD